MRRLRVLSARLSGAVSFLFAVTWPLLALAAALPALTLVRGCANWTALSTRDYAVVPPTTHTSNITATVRLSPLYREAQRDCRAEWYLPAADALERLENSPGLTPAQSAFRREQRAIWLRDAETPVPTSPPTPLSIVSIAATVLRPDQADCGPHALFCARLRRPCSLTALRCAAGTTASGTTMAGLVAAASPVGLRPAGEQVGLAALRRLSGTAVAWVDGDHYIAVLSVWGDAATVPDPNRPREEDISTSALMARSGGVPLTVHR